MRKLLIVAVFGMSLIACAAPRDVVVTESQATFDTLPSAIDHSATTEPGERPVPSVSLRTLEDLLLTPTDVPGWNHSGPMKVPGEPTFIAENCSWINTAWSAAGSPGVRTRGSIGATGFRNTVVEFVDTAAAGAILDAVDRVPSECVEFTEAPDVTWWSEPFAMPAGTTRRAGIVVGNQSLASWAIGFWQVDAAVVVLEVDGDDMWQQADALFAAMSARLDGAPQPVPTLQESGVEPTENPTTSALPTPTALPLAPEPSDEFPPVGDDWIDHSLAALVPAPAELGPDWTYDYGSTNEASPSDPGQMIDGCDVTAPPMLDGISVSYERATDRVFEQEAEFEIGRGGPTEVGSIVETFRLVAACDLSEAGFPGGLSIVDGVEFDEASDAIVLTGTSDYPGSESLAVIAIVRYDDLVVAAFSASVDGGSVDAAVIQIVGFVELIASKR